MRTESQRRSRGWRVLHPGNHRHRRLVSRPASAIRASSFPIHSRAGGSHFMRTSPYPPKKPPDASSRKSSVALRSPLAAPPRIKDLRIYICRSPMAVRPFANTKYKVGGLAHRPRDHAHSGRAGTGNRQALATPGLEKRGIRRPGSQGRRLRLRALRGSSSAEVIASWTRSRRAFTCAITSPHPARSHPVAQAETLSSGGGSGPEVVLGSGLESLRSCAANFMRSAMISPQTRSGLSDCRTWMRA